MKFQSLVLFLIVFMVACSASMPTIQPPTKITVPTVTVHQTLTIATATTLIPTKITASFCQPPGYPGTIHYANSDNFGDGFVALIRVEDVTAKSQEEITGILVSQWLDHNKTQSQSPSATIKDYTIDKVNLLDPSCDPFFEIVAGVRFSIIPNQIPNDYASFPGELFNPNDIWWHLWAPFGIFKDGDFYKLRLVFGWGT
jgi:hypothetical protein